MPRAPRLPPRLLGRAWDLLPGGSTAPAGVGAQPAAAAVAAAPARLAPPGMALSTAAAGAAAPGGGADAAKAAKQAARKAIIRSLKALSPEAMAAQSEGRPRGCARGDDGARSRSRRHRPTPTRTRARAPPARRAHRGARPRLPRVRGRKHGGRLHTLRQAARGRHDAHPAGGAAPRCALGGSGAVVGARRQVA
jgi:hypothetical protein